MGEMLLNKHSSTKTALSPKKENGGGTSQLPLCSLRIDKVEAKLLDSPLQTIQENSQLQKVWSRFSVSLL